MKKLILIILIAISANLNAQTYNTTIEKAENVTIKQGKVTIGKIVINEDYNKWKMYVDTAIQFQDEYSVWHTIIVFKSLDNNPMFSASINLDFDLPVINFKSGMCCIASQGLSPDKKHFALISTQLQKNPFPIVINSEKRIVVTINGMVKKP